MDEKYYFIYKDSNGNWGRCTNPFFIARHTYCRAIKKTELKRSLNYILQKLNNGSDGRIIKYLYFKYSLGEF